MKIFLILLISIFVLSSCNINQEENEKIQKQRIFDNNIKCNTFFKNHNKFWYIILSMKYSEKLNSCIGIFEDVIWSNLIIKNIFSDKILFNCKFKDSKDNKDKDIGNIKIIYKSCNEKAFDKFREL